MAVAPVHFAGSPNTAQLLELAEQRSAHNYHPLPVVVAEADGAWVTDVDGRRYLDFLAGYSALNFGHRHPDLVNAAIEQLNRVTLTSRAFHHDQFGPFCQELAELTGTDRVLPMNSGAEAVESAIKIARKWAYQVKGVPEDRAEIIVAGSNFHGRTTTIVSFSTDPVARAEFGPFTPGFVTTPYGDASAVEAAIGPDTAAVLVEPIQGEAGVIVPPADYLPRLRQLCDEHDVLLIADEIQSGLARTGELLACQHADVRADLYTLGKALGGGILPVSAVCCAPVSTAPRSAATRWPARSAAPSSACCAPASSSSAPGNWANTCTGACGSWSGAGFPRSAVEACGQVWRSPRAGRPGGRPAKHCWPRACCARRRTSPRSGSPRLW